MFRGFATANVFVDDLPAAVAWYSEVFGIQPYFEREVDGKPAYVEFRVGDYQHEFGLVDAKFSPDKRDEPGGATIYWHVDDVQATFERLIELGAKVRMPPIERGPGFVPASVIDPFGNILGVMYNQHYLDILG